MSDSTVTVVSDYRPPVAAGKPYWPVATFVILGINAILFLIATLAGGSTSTSVLLDLGASFRPYFLRGEYWRLVMPMFLHVGWLHLVVNCYAFFILGPILERIYGYGRFALLYVVSGIGSSALSVALSTNVAAGASGAIFGIAGAMLVAGFLHRGAIPRHWARAFGKGILPFIILTLILGFTAKGIDYWGHLGGLATGMALAGFLPPLQRQESAPWPGSEKPSQAIVALPIAVVVLAMAAAAQHYVVSRDVSRLLQQGTQLRTAHQDSAALACFQVAARRSPRDERPHAMMGALYQEQVQYDKAIQEYIEAVRLMPGSPEPRLVLGMAYLAKGDFGKAQQAFEAAMGKDPASADGQRLLADLYAQQKRYPEAIRHYKEALRIDPSLAGTRNNLAWLYATSDDLKLRDPQAALEYARQAVEATHWKESGFIDTLAEANYASGNYQEAVRIEVVALKFDPHNPELQAHMVRYRKAAGL
jgi:rhomboid protease GluP